MSPRTRLIIQKSSFYLGKTAILPLKAPLLSRGSFHAALPCLSLYHLVMNMRVCIQCERTSNPMHDGTARIYRISAEKTSSGGSRRLRVARRGPTAAPGDLQVRFGCRLQKCLKDSKQKLLF